MLSKWLILVLTSTIVLSELSSTDEIRGNSPNYHVNIYDIFIALCCYIWIASVRFFSESCSRKRIHPQHEGPSEA